jgi:hypothetical protein
MSLSLVPLIAGSVYSGVLRGDPSYANNLSRAVSGKSEGLQDLIL